MSTKPVTLPRWSTDMSNMTAPSSGQQDTGWTPGQDGISDYDNWAKFWTYKWIEYINDGDIALNNVAVGGTLDVTALTSLNGGLAVTGDITGTGKLDVDGLVEGSALYFTVAVPIIIPGATFYSTVHSPLNSVNGHKIGLLMVANTAPYTIPITGLQGEVGS